MMSIFGYGSCCDRAMFDNEPYCPVCGGQRSEHVREVQAAQESASTGGMRSARVRELVARGIVPPEEAAETALLSRSVLARYPARRAVFRLLGIYLPEAQAQVVLREIHNFKWIAAEKAGEDIWRKRAPENPFAAAAREWAGRYLDLFLQWICQVRNHNTSRRSPA